VCAVLKSVVVAARGGDVAAAKLLLSYCIGIPCDSVTEARLTALEAGRVAPVAMIRIYEDTVDENEN
jgi:hypothetical protein